MTYTMSRVCRIANLFPMNERAELRYIDVVNVAHLGEGKPDKQLIAMLREHINNNRSQR